MRWILAWAPIAALLAGCGEQTALQVDEAGAVRARWVERGEWEGLHKVHRSYLVIGPVENPTARLRVRCGGAADRLAVHPRVPLVAHRCEADHPWRAAWYGDLVHGSVDLGECVPLGAGAAPRWPRDPRITSYASCAARLAPTGDLYALVERDGGDGALAELLIDLVDAPGEEPALIGDGAGWSARYRALPHDHRARIDRFLLAAALADDCDPMLAVLAAEHLALPMMAAPADALVRHLDRYVTGSLGGVFANRYERTVSDRHGELPQIRRLLARLSPVRPEEVARIACPMTRISMRRWMRDPEPIPEAHAAVRRRPSACPP